MSRRSGRISLQGAIAPRQSGGHVIAQSHVDAVAPLKDEDIPRAHRGSSPAGRPKPESSDREIDGQVHRSLYAKLATIELIRRLAFEERVPAQRLYREGLLLMLQARGLYKDKTLEDV